MLGAPTEGGPHGTRGQGGTSYIPGINSGLDGGGTYTGQNMQPSIKDYENFLGPAGRDIKEDPMRDKRHQRIHLPQAYLGHNQYLTDRVDGLITDATNSPFTTKILPYKYQQYPDNKIKWNVWSFDEGMASRVPYESAARVLTQSKRQFAGYMVRQGMAIVLEHNFMMSEKGRTNFQNQLMQMVGSIQYTNDLDVHIALVQAPSYEKHIREKYYVDDKSNMQICREYVDLFGFMQKNNNALDILIEEAKARLKSWGGPMPDFLLCNSKLTFQLTMTPEKTNWVTNGYDGQKRLKTGPDIPSYRGINVIHSRCFSMEGGTPPRDILKRRVRVAEYYRIPPDHNNMAKEFQFYNEERDTWFSYSFLELLSMAVIDEEDAQRDENQRAITDAIDEINNAINNGLAPPPRKAGTFGFGKSGRRDDAAGNLPDDTSFVMGPPTDAPDGQQYVAPFTRETDKSRLAGSAAHLGVELRGATYCKSDIIKAVAVKAMEAVEAGRKNWTPSGTFVTDDCFMAFGAISWNRFYRGSLYAPPHMYYFSSGVKEYTVPGSRNAIGWEKQLDLINALKSKIPSTMIRAMKAFDTTADGNLSDDQDNLNLAKVKIQLAMLFESLCSYPRVIGEFNLNGLADQHLRTDLALFKHGSYRDAKFKTSIRFRNWMRYGVASELFLKDGQVFQSMLTGNTDKDDWKNGTFMNTETNEGIMKFDQDRDNGLAFLREPGAFLAPNHFKNDDTFETFALFSGANIILTSEMISEIFKCKQDTQVLDMRDFAGVGCSIFDMLNSANISDFVAKLNVIIQKVQAEYSRLSKIKQNRIELTSLYIKSGILDLFKEYNASSGYSTEHLRNNYIWTWPREKVSAQEIWCHETDYRLYDIKTGNILADGVITQMFPGFQVGTAAINHWVENIYEAVDVSGVTAPELNLTVSNTINTAGPFGQLITASTGNKQEIISFASQWPFTKNLKDVPGDIGQAVQFLIQLLYRCFFDQSEPNLLVDANKVSQFANLGIPKGPYAMKKQSSPAYSGEPGGELFSGRLDLSKRTLETYSGAQFLGATPEELAAMEAKKAAEAAQRQQQGRGGQQERAPMPYPSGMGPMPITIPAIAHNIEIVVVRPNIEHQMLGIIMGQGGENLGATLWGQTELSCYDDSMHGIWGMSYKYHERAIVFNEKNLVRLWDVAYDGYTGGKNDTYVKWKEHADFKEHTNNISTNYRGPSMMVMAFVHEDTASDEYKNGFKRNWPSPIVFHDQYDFDTGDGDNNNNIQNMSMDADNIRSVNINEFRVFNNNLYKGYKEYQERMPDFTTLHTARKPAGAGSAEGETCCEALAFQGTMKVINSFTRAEIENIQGSGHHGPDWVGVASIRAGKGYKTGGPLTLQRMV